MEVGRETLAKSYNTCKALSVSESGIRELCPLAQKRKGGMSPLLRALNEIRKVSCDKSKVPACANWSCSV